MQENASSGALPNAFQLPADDDAALLQVLATQALAAGWAAFDEVLGGVARDGQGACGGQGGRGDDGARLRGKAAQAFGHAAVQRVEELLQRSGRPMLLLHDGAPRRIGRGAPLGRIILTPVDDLAALARGLPFSALAHMALVMAPAAGPLSAAAVRAALVQPLMQADDTCFLLRRGKPLMSCEGMPGKSARQVQPQAQAQHDASSACRERAEVPLQVSSASSLADAAIAVNLTGHAPGRALAEVIGSAREVLASNSTSAALLALARGQVDVCIDMRGTLSARDWLAGAALARAAGAVIMLLDDALEQANAPGNLMQRRGIIAAASRPLLEEVLAALRRTWL